MPDVLTVHLLRDAVQHAVAFRSRRRLQPGGGEGDKVFPPTFAGAVYAIERRHVAQRTDPVQCVLLDSVQSQANRMELALQEAVDAGELAMPLLVVDFSDHDPTGDVEADQAAGRLIDRVGKITSLQLPHRLADAILRDSELDGVEFRKSEHGKALNTASLTNATPVFAVCPTALVFGMWDSTGPKGGLGAKFERAMVSEVVGIGAQWHEDYRARGVRRDPLEIRRAVKVVKENTGAWKVADSAKGAVEPSKINHSSVPFDSKNSGVTIEYAEQLTTLSLICLRRLKFPLQGKQDPSVDVAARTVLAALGLCAATLAFESGMGLRSRCLLCPEGPMHWELLGSPGAEPKVYSLPSSSAIELLQQAVSAATSAGLPWDTTPVTLKPSSRLLDLVRRSQSEATKEEAGAD
jgi:CRISPR-associated protein Csb1